jgi:hypothetical protein
VLIYNDSKRALLLRVAPGACTAVNWTVKLYTDDAFEAPFPAYTGDISGMWIGVADPAGGSQVTEWTIL